MAPAPFLTLGPLRQLLGMAFAPDYSVSGRFYVYWLDADFVLRLTRFTASNPDLADPASATTLLSLPNPTGDHAGGWIGFGPDGYLYLAIGDGGPWFDPFGRAQDLSLLFGKILRLDVSGPGLAIPPTNPFAGSVTNRPEIWSYGLRNPWRCSFDRATGDLWIADVGQDAWEELNLQVPSSPPYTARNYGWRCFEANSVQSTTTGPGGEPCPPPTSVTFPVFAYDHAVGCSVIGGYVYRGRSMPWLRGTYFFADYCTASVRSLRHDAGVVHDLVDHTAELATPGLAIDGIASFGEDAEGEVYICDLGGGEVYKIVPRCLADCTGGTEPPVLSVNDFICFLNLFAAQDPFANCDGSTIPPTLNVSDFVCYLNRFAAGCT
ncbi:MAG: PQQ-dependent sugar dehydrogenase [Phycisphaerales bacterium]